MSSASESVTTLLARAGDGDASAVHALMPIVYDELRRMASAQLRYESNATLNTTALVHEAFLKLVDHRSLGFDCRAHFFGAAARAMRQILVDRARSRLSQKRGGGNRPESIEVMNLRGEAVSADEASEELIALDEALERLEQVESRMARVVECRFFVGLTVEETAEVLDISVRTVKRDWRGAKAWLFQEIYGD
ncbi:MAG: sigma-70 family RNA polymerase sigma factor [Rhodothermales bacterium]